MTNEELRKDLDDKLTIFEIAVKRGVKATYIAKRIAEIKKEKTQAPMKSDRTNGLRPFDLKVGDKVSAADEDGLEKAFKRTEYIVVGIYAHIFEAQKLTGNKCVRGFSKVDYQIGEVRKK